MDNLNQKKVKNLLRDNRIPGVNSQGGTMLAMGGPVTPGLTALVGEIGPELFVPAIGRPRVIGADGPEILDFHTSGTVIPNHLLVPEGRILGDVRAWLGLEELAVGGIHRRGALTVQVLPFVRQDDYDRVLWSCDFNAVRGEDSFVRAQWAGRPLLWHIYVQEEYAHWEKLEAFLDLYTPGLSGPAAAALVELWRAWNMDRDMGEAWKQVLVHWDELAAHAGKWCAEQAARPDLATALVQFYRNWI